MISFGCHAFHISADNTPFEELSQADDRDSEEQEDDCFNEPEGYWFAGGAKLEAPKRRHVICGREVFEKEVKQSCG